MATTAPKISVAVIGGGIGGLSLTLGLLELPHLDVQLYESAKEFGEVGLGVNIAPNSQKALSMLSKNSERAFLAEKTSSVGSSGGTVSSTLSHAKILLTRRATLS